MITYLNVTAFETGSHQRHLRKHHKCQLLACLWWWLMLFLMFLKWESRNCIFNGLIMENLTRVIWDQRPATLNAACTFKRWIEEEEVFICEGRSEWETQSIWEWGECTIPHHYPAQPFCWISRWPPSHREYISYMEPLPWIPHKDICWWMLHLTFLLCVHVKGERGRT